MNSTKKNIHIFGITESHTTSSVNDGELSIDGYNMIRKDRSTGIGGGVICYIRDDLKWQRRNDLEQPGIECIWIELYLKNSKSILIAIIYKPPDSSKHLDKKFTEKLDSVISISTNENKESLIIGDINCDYLVPNDHKEIKDIFKFNGFKQVIKDPTRITTSSRTLIDIAATTHANRIDETIVMGNSISDHELIGIVRKLHLQKYQPRKIISRDYSKFNEQLYKIDLRNLPWENVVNIIYLNKAWNLFKNLIDSVINIHTPLKERLVRGNDCRWMTTKIQKAIKDRYYAIKFFCKFFV